MTHHCHNNTVWQIDYLVVFKICINSFTISSTIWYSDSQICANGSLILFKNSSKWSWLWSVMWDGHQHVCLRSCSESSQLDLHLVNSSVSPKIHVSKWQVYWEKNKVNFIVTYLPSLFYVNLLWNYMEHPSTYFLTVTDLSCSSKHYG